MTLKLVSTFALSSLALLAVACSAGPQPDSAPAGASSDALVLLECTRPFTTLEIEEVDGVNRHPRSYCALLTGTPTGSSMYPDAVCGGVLAPPSNLAECTYGMTIIMPFAPATDVWACPMYTPVPGDTDTEHYGWSSGATHNPCFGDITDGGWIFIWHYSGTNGGGDGCKGGCAINPGA